MKVELEVLPFETVLQNHGLQEGESVQRLVDDETMRYMSAYMPRRQAEKLEHMMIMAAVIGSGRIDISRPYVNYLHEGILYVSPATGGAWTEKSEIKVPTDRELTYASALMRGKKRFERMKADHKNGILQAAQALVDRGGKV